MSKEKKITQEVPQSHITYYGKKVYSLNPLIAQKTPTKDKFPDFSNDEENENGSNILSNDFSI